MSTSSVTAHWSCLVQDVMCQERGKEMLLQQKQILCTCNRVRLRLDPHPSFGHSHISDEKNPAANFAHVNNSKDALRLILLVHAHRSTNMCVVL